MADKAIKQYNETTTTQTGTTTDEKDALLMQRGNDYFWIDPVGARLGVQKASITLTNLEVRALQSGQQIVVAAQGAGKYIVPLHDYIVREAGTAYATQTTLRGRFTSALETDYFTSFNSILAGTAKLLRVGDMSNANTEDLLENDDFVLYAPSSDPITGTGSVTYVLYFMVIEA